MTGTIQPPLLAWAWRIAVGDPGRRAADRPPPRVAARQPRPRRRRAAVARAARRVGARLLAEVRPGLGAAARTRGSAFRCWSRATGGSAGTRGGSATRGGPVLCEVMTNVLWGLARLAAGRALDHPGARRPALGRAQRPLPRRGAARRRCAPTVADLGGARAPGAARPAGGDRPAPGRGAPARPERATGCERPPPSVSAAEPSFEPDRGPGLAAPLLARADLGQRGLDAVAGPAPARLRATRPRLMAERLRETVAARGPARVLRPATPARASARPTSPGRSLILELRRARDFGDPRRG